METHDNDDDNVNDIYDSRIYDNVYGSSSDDNDNEDTGNDVYNVNNTDDCNRGHDNNV